MEDTIYFETETELEGWQVTDAGSANWAIEKIREAENEIERAEQKRLNLIDSAVKICGEAVEPLINKIEFFKNKLRHYAETSGKRTEKFPAGTLKLKKQPDKFIFDDGEVASSDSKKLLDWCGVHQTEFVKEKITRTVDWANLKKSLKVSGEEVCDENGEVIDGLKCFSQEDKFLVVTNDEKSS